jgi:hypothetical protein
LLGLLAGLLAGCLTGKPEESVSWRDHFQPLCGPTGPDVVQMDVALLERPVGDRYVNQDLWEFVDEQTIGPEQKGVLEDNGLRVGQVGGIPPAGLQMLLTSDASCVNPRRIRLHAGNPTTLLIGPPLPTCHFQVHTVPEPVTVDVEQAQCTLVVVPTLTKDGHIRLQFTPQVPHGETVLMPCPVPESSRWVLQEQRPTEKFPATAWEITLAPNEYVVVGGRFDRPDTLGHRFFLHADATTPVQQLLVIRASGDGPMPCELLADAPADDGSPNQTVPPVALQAGAPTARGLSP